MRSLILLIIILLIALFTPSPYYKKTTTCVNETECTSQSSFEWGPSLFHMFRNKLSGVKIETTR